MFDMLCVNEARFIAMQKQVKIPNISFTAEDSHAQGHAAVACLTGN